MKYKAKNLIYVLIILILTLTFLLAIPQIPNYSKSFAEDSLPLNMKWISVFLIANLLIIGLASGIHNIYSGDYSRIKNIWFFIIFGAVTGILLGEQGNLIMLFPYTIIMLIYSLLYKKFTWWKV